MIGLFKGAVQGMEWGIRLGTGLWALVRLSGVKEEEFWGDTEEDRVRIFLNLKKIRKES